MGHRRDDLRAQRFPLAGPEDWRDPGQALTTLYRHAEDKALQAIDWYLRDKRSKKLSSRVLRAVAIILAAAGGVQPLVSIARPGQGNAGWGYVLLALAAACIGFDRFFGLSSGWMRAISTAQAIQSSLERFQFEWAATCACTAMLPARPEQVLDRLQLLRAFSEQLLDLVRGETAEWVVEFQSSLSSLAQLEVSGRDSAPTLPSRRRATDGSADSSPATTGPARAGE